MEARRGAVEADIGADARLGGVRVERLQVGALMEEPAFDDGADEIRFIRHGSTGG